MYIKHILNSCIGGWPLSVPCMSSCSVAECSELMYMHDIVRVHMLLLSFLFFHMLYVTPKQRFDIHNFTCQNLPLLIQDISEGGWCHWQGVECCCRSPWIWAVVCVCTATVTSRWVNAAYMGLARNWWIICRMGFGWIVMLMGSGLKNGCWTEYSWSGECDNASLSCRHVGAYIYRLLDRGNAVRSIGESVHGI